MATAFARSSGANARADEWDSPAGNGKGKGNWLPLDALDGDEDLYTAAPRPRQTAAAPRPEWAQSGAMPRTGAVPQARTAQHPQQRPATRQQPKISVGTVQVKSLAVA